MKAHLTAACRQRGVAVVTALLLTTLSVTIVASLFWQQQVEVRSIENQRLQLQKQWVLRGALDWAALILREDAKHSSVDDLTEPWAVPLAETPLDQYIEQGRADEEAADAALSGGISDAQARLNLTNLCTGGTINYAEVAAFARLLDNARLDPALAQKTAGLIAVTFAKPTAPAPGDQPAQPMALTQVDDLLAVPGFTPQALEKIRNLIIFLPRATPVNVNTAPAEVLAARIETLTLADAASLVASRDNAGFRDVTDFSNRLSGKSVAISASDASFTVKTDYFLVNGKARISRAGLEVVALIERNGPTTKLIWIREY